MPIALLTDFGTGSVYVGQVKGVLATRAPAVPAIDLTHEIAPQAVDEAAFLLAHAIRYFPHGTVFLAVVDPGVGTDRDIVILAGAERTFVAPDNGLLALALDKIFDPRAFRVGREAYHGASATFHGRDVMAPLAARLASGESPDALGEPVALEALVPYPAPRPRWEGGARCCGRVVHIDRFGDLVTDVVPPRTQRVQAARLGSRQIPRVARTYGDVDPGTLFVYEGSFGTLEIGLRDGSAAGALGARRGAEVDVTFEEP